jgi:formyltetrahydrofolate deformylase
MPTFLLTLSCPDRPGIVANVAQSLVDAGANIVESAQFSDPVTSTFCLRTKFDAPSADAAALESLLRAGAAALGATITVRSADHRPRVLLMVSKYDHCLLDLLYRWQLGELPIDIPIVVSNHPDLAGTAARHGLAFEHIPVSAATKPQAEARLLELVAVHEVDLVILARYMQVLSNDLCAALSGKAINIHHSFLPGFKGAKPYHQAWERGVKLIGATAHYVTGELDEGPIIDQDVERVSHSHSAAELVTIGRDVERVVLSRAVKAHVERRVFLLGHRTVVFN